MEVWQWALLGGGVLAVLALPLIYTPGTGDNAEPALAEGTHVVRSTVRIVEVPLEPFQAWLENVAIEDVLPKSGIVPKVESSELVAGTWGEPGARRLVRLEGGGKALEQIIVNEPPHYFSYKIWAMGGLPERLIRYIRGEFILTPLPGGRTRMEWRYIFRPRTTLAYPYVLLVAGLGFSGYLSGGADNIQAAGEAAAGAR